MMFKAFFKRAAAAVLFAAAASPAMAADLEISGAWLRAVPPVSPTMAGYFEIRNRGDRVVKLEGADVDFAGGAMLHGSRSGDDGQRRMVHLDSVRVEPGDRVRFAPGGKHLMLMKLNQVPRAGESVEVCLTFANHDDLCTDFPVRHNAP